VTERPSRRPLPVRAEESGLGTQPFRALFGQIPSDLDVQQHEASLLTRLKYLDIETLSPEKLDVKTFCVKLLS
jgi:hypothetical protein